MSEDYVIKDLRGTQDSSADFELAFVPNGKTGRDVLLFRIYNENELSLFEYKDDDSYEVSIPSEIEGFSVTRIEDQAFAGGLMDRISLPDTIKSIGQKAFYNCYLLKELIIPASVIYIGEMAFFGCMRLQKIEISQSVSEIGKNAFGGCPDLSSIVVDPKNNFYDSRDNCNAIISTFDNKMLFACKDTVIPRSVKVIGGAFNSCWSLKEYVVPNHIVEIGESAFQQCENLEKIVIPDSVKRIGSYAFYGCVKLQEIFLPKSIKEVGEYAFAWCESLIKVVIPLSLKVIPTHAFTYCMKLQELALPKSIKEMGDYSFSGCESIIKVDIPKGLKVIPAHAFENCLKLKEVVIPDTVTTIGESAFKDTSIENLFIPKSVVAIGSNNASSYSSGFSSSVFEGNKLFSIRVSPSNKVYDSRKNCNAIVETATNTIIQGCNYTIIPDSVANIAHYSFHDCKGINSLVFSDAVTTIGNNSFDGCSGLQELVIPASVVEIAPLAFKGCSPSAIRVSTDNTIYDSRDDCNAIIETATNRLILCNNTLTIPNTVREIPEGVLCSDEIVSINIPDSVQMVDEDAFLECSNLHQIIIKNPSIVENSVKEEAVVILSPQNAEADDGKSIESLERNIKQIESDLSVKASSYWDEKLVFSQKVINAIRKNDNDDSKYEFSDFFNKIYVALKRQVDSENHEYSMKNVFFEVLKSSFGYFSSLKFVKYLNIYNLADKNENECVEYYADFIHSLNGNHRLTKRKKLVSNNRKNIDNGEIDEAASIMEMIFHGGDALANVFEYSAPCVFPIYAKMCYAIKCNANEIKYVYDDSLWDVFDNALDWDKKEKKLINWLDTLDYRYDKNNGVTNTIFMIGCPWGSFSTQNEFEKYVLRANIGIGVDKFQAKREEIIVFLNQLQSFLIQVSSELINNIKDRQRHQTAVVASVTQAMIRNMSHNWSHVFNHYTSDRAYEKFSDEYIKQNLHSYIPLEGEDKLAIEGKNLQLPYFVQYQSNRQNYLSEMTFDAPATLTTKRFYGDIMKELDQKRVPLNYISGVSGFTFSFSLKYNGTKMDGSNDISIVLPDALGNQALFNIIENIIRNTAKHSKHGNNDVVFTLDCKDILDYPDYFCLEIDNGVEENDIDQLVCKQNELLNESVLDENYKLRSHGLGLLEMTVAAAFLRQIEISEIDSCEYKYVEDDDFCNKHNNLILLKAINKNGALGYRFFLKKPKEILFVGNYSVAEALNNKMVKEGAMFISEKDFAEAMREGKSFAHHFLFYHDTITAKTKDYLSDKNDYKSLLPVRKIELSSEELFEIIGAIRWDDRSEILAQLKNVAWKMYFNEKILAGLRNPQNNGVKICTAYDPFKGKGAFISNQVVFMNHAYKKTHAKQWKQASGDSDSESWIENLSSRTCTKLPFFNRYAVGEVDPISDYVENIRKLDSVKYEIFEAYHNKVVALDERIQRFSNENFEGSSSDVEGPIPCSELFKSTNVLIPPTPLDPNAFDEASVEKIEQFIEDNMANAFVLVHYGILERMYKDETAISKKLDAWAKAAKRVVVTSGRGSHSLTLPSSVCFANLSSVLYAFAENRNKFLINNMLNQSRRKNG